MNLLNIYADAAVHHTIQKPQSDAQPPFQVKSHTAATLLLVRAGHACRRLR